MYRSIDIDLLRAFLAVMEGGSFTTAARSLNRTQSALSMQIKRLEALLGCPLFDRRPGQPILTRQGELLAGYAQRLIALNDETLTRVGNEPREGIIRIGINEDYAIHMLPGLLARFMLTHSNVAIEMETGFTSLLMNRLGTVFDLVLAVQPDGTGRGEVIRRSRAVWVGSRRHPICDAEVLSLALHPAECQFRQAALAALDREKRKWQLVYISQSLAALESFVSAGAAITVTNARTVPRGLAVLGAREGFAHTARI
jgi:DNA-binding transcriptional LysR family regulator